MERKEVSGTVRNKERSKTKFLEAVGKILKTQGFTGLKINNIASEAGVDKKMIYTYFGGLDGLMDTYIRSQDYWSNVSTEKIQRNSKDGGKVLLKEMLYNQFRYVHEKEELQKLLLWRLSEERPALRKMTELQEENGDELFKAVFDPHFGKNAEKFRAITALLVSGLYYLNLYAVVNGSSFSGLDMQSEKGRKQVEEALSFLIDKTYEEL
ncbi:TetR/AcrR family transcriptional regulator [Flavobacterium anhuiense]|uniref:TetR/AcrR family transcriptional regulator n=1 Tax=Flavobacterium anhuiense TaxID=459526 RepID=UPI00118367BD|nr:TetR/AcrR family transcriptional regulator [Flavobacterium anhuiense]